MSDHALSAGPGIGAAGGETKTGAEGPAASRRGGAGPDGDSGKGTAPQAMLRTPQPVGHPERRRADRAGPDARGPQGAAPESQASDDAATLESKALSSTDPDDLRYLIHHAELPATRFSTVVDGALARLGSAMSWFWLVLMAVIVANVILKNAFGDGRIEFEEIQWHIYSALFMLGLSVTLVADDHVRVDILYERFSLRTKAWVDLVGILFLLLPFLAMLVWYGVPFVADSLATGERSSAPAGLPYRWLIKGALVAGCLLLALAAVSRLTRILAYLSSAGGRAAGRGE